MLGVEWMTWNHFQPFYSLLDNFYPSPVGLIRTHTLVLAGVGMNLINCSTRLYPQGEEVALQKVIRLIPTGGIGRWWAFRIKDCLESPFFSLGSICSLIKWRMENWKKEVLQFTEGNRLGSEQAKKDGEPRSQCKRGLCLPRLLSFREKTFLTGFLESGMAECFFSWCFLICE